MKPALSFGYNRSGTTGTGSTAVAAKNTVRRSLVIQNISDTPMWVNPLGTAAAADTYFYLGVNAIIEITTTDAVNIYSGSSGKKFSAIET